MDYEQFLSEAQPIYKELKDKTVFIAKTVKKIEKNVNEGDINGLPKLYNAIRDATRESGEALERIETLSSGFNGTEYMASGKFSEQTVELCRQSGIDVQGSFPVYEMFPCRVTVNPETQDITVDRKRIQCLRPSKLVGDIKVVLDKLARTSFNTRLFAQELAAAYDMAILKAGKKKHYAENAPVYAQDLYDILTPMKRYKKDYTKHEYAYGLARLYAEDCVTIDDGRTLRFDTVRDMRKAIRILDRNGAEQFITTIRFSK